MALRVPPFVRKLHVSDAIHSDSRWLWLSLRYSGSGRALDCGHPAVLDRSGSLPGADARCFVCRSAALGRPRGSSVPLCVLMLCPECIRWCSCGFPASIAATLSSGEHRDQQPASDACTTGRPGSGRPCLIYVVGRLLSSVLVCPRSLVRSRSFWSVLVRSGVCPGRAEIRGAPRLTSTPPNLSRAL